MCSSKSKRNQGSNITPTIAKINGRPVLQPTCNQVLSLEQCNPLKKKSPKSLSLPPPPLLLPTTTVNAKTKPSMSPPLSPKLKLTIPPAPKRASDSNRLNISAKKALTSTISKGLVKKSLKSSGGGVAPPIVASLKYSSLILEAPGSIAAARREHVAIMQEQRKMRNSHYGKTNATKYQGKITPLDASTNNTDPETKRCSFITPNSDLIYVAYHDEEWGVAVHDDKLLLELLMLTSAQVGSDWTSVLKNRQDFREAFSAFDAEVVSKFTEKKITSISAEYGIDISQVRGVIDNSKRILEVKKEFGSFDKYLWGFVNHKPISTHYKSCYKIPAKTSKSETISKDMVRRGFRLVGPTVIHSFMQAVGLTNDHLITCPKYLQCISSAFQRPAVAPALSFLIKV